MTPSRQMTWRIPNDPRLRRPAVSPSTQFGGEDCLSPPITQSEAFGGVVGSAFGQVGDCVGGTVGLPSVVPL